MAHKVPRTCLDESRRERPMPQSATTGSVKKRLCQPVRPSARRLTLPPYRGKRYLPRHLPYYRPNLDAATRQYAQHRTAIANVTRYQAPDMRPRQLSNTAISVENPRSLTVSRRGYPRCTTDRSDESPAHPPLNTETEIAPAPTFAVSAARSPREDRDVPVHHRESVTNAVAAKSDKRRALGEHAHCERDRRSRRIRLSWRNFPIYRATTAV